MAYQLLVVEDSQTMRKVVQITFDREDFEVVTVGTAQEAMVRAAAGPPHAVLVDLSLPDMDGYALCQALKGDPATSQVPVCLMAGSQMPFDEQRARAAGATEHINKPFETQALVDKIKGMVGAPITAAVTSGLGRKPAPPASPATSSNPVATPAAAPLRPAPAQPTTPPGPPSAPPAGIGRTPPPAAATATPAAAAILPAAVAPRAAAAPGAPRPAPSAGSPAPMTPPPHAAALPAIRPVASAATTQPANALSASPPTAHAAVPQQGPPRLSVPAESAASVADPSSSTLQGGASATTLLPRAVPPPPAIGAPRTGGPIAPASRAPVPPMRGPMSAGLPSSSPAPTPTRENRTSPPAPALDGPATDSMAALSPAAPPLKAPTAAQTEPRSPTPSREAITAETRAIIEAVVWEIVPELAETLIRERLEELIKSREG